MARTSLVQPVLIAGILCLPALAQESPPFQLDVQPSIFHEVTDAFRVTAVVAKSVESEAESATVVIYSIPVLSGESCANGR